MVKTDPVKLSLDGLGTYQLSLAFGRVIWPAAVIYASHVSWPAAVIHCCNQLQPISDNEYQRSVITINYARERK